MNVEEIIYALEELLEEDDFPKQIKIKITETITALQKTPDNVCVSRAVSSLGDAAENSNLQSYHRMQLFSVVSLLESN